MVNRPFKNRRPIGPFLQRGTGIGKQTKDDTHNNGGDPHFRSIEDLPDSPMLRQYVRNQADYLDEDIENIINSEPVKDYMRRLGVWEQAVSDA